MQTLKMLCLGSMGSNHVKVNHVIKGQFFEGNYRKMTISWSFSYNAFVKFHDKKIWEPHHGRVFIHVQSMFK